MYLEQLDLHPGERVLWSGSPTRFPVFDRADAILVPFSVVWCAFVTNFLVSALHEGAPPFFVVVSAAFLLYGLYFVFGRLVVRRMALRSTVYTVTDRRLVIVSRSPFGNRRERTAYLKDLPPPVVTPGAGTAGTITFGGSSLWNQVQAEQPGLGSRGDFVPVLVEVADARQVRDTIVGAQAVR